MKASLLKIQRRKDSEGKNVGEFNNPAGRTNSNFKILSFSVCLLIAFSLWLMNTLSKKYTESLLFNIEYSNFPHLKGDYSSTDTLKLKVNSSGYRILAYKIGVMDRTIKIDAGQFRHKENQYIYNLNNHIHQSKIEEQLGEEVKLMDIAPDTLFILLRTKS